MEPYSRKQGKFSADGLNFRSWKRVSINGNINGQHPDSKQMMSAVALASIGLGKTNNVSPNCIFVYDNQPDITTRLPASDESLACPGAACTASGDLDVELDRVPFAKGTRQRANVISTSTELYKLVLSLQSHLHHPNHSVEALLLRAERSLWEDRTNHMRFGRMSWQLGEYHEIDNTLAYGNVKRSS
ncbi:hypothetical protein JB92DRAFT_2836450 [Gautieria morchelliformis]|nr:hypothetical protein JB92DRAFT_2836450 [Gautieria morchelliformis]